MSERDIVRLGFDPDWTAEQAIQAGADGPRSPLHKWTAWHELNDHEQAFNDGHNESLLSALAVCALHDLPMPEWLADGYLSAFNEWVTYRVGGLDEAFGVGIQKGKHLNKLREKRLLIVAVPMKLKEIRDRDNCPIDEALFAEVGKALNISAGKAKEIYYQSPFKGLLKKAPNS